MTHRETHSGARRVDERAGRHDRRAHALRQLRLRFARLHAWQRRTCLLDRRQVVQMFDVIGVIDLRHGDAVRAKGGRRDQYLPIETVAEEAVPRGDAKALARCYAERFGLERVYVADLDAIERRAPQHAVVRTIASVGVPVWLDAGVTSSDDARQAMECGASRLIVGLETLSSFEVLESIVRAVGRERVVFSLD